LIGAIVLLGGLGYWFDAWRGSAPWGLVSGLILALIVGFYELARAVWHR
jgi:F0F1-type ATP synthase assembly protein I